MTEAAAKTPKHWKRFLTTEETEENCGKKPHRDKQRKDNDGLPTTVLLKLPGASRDGHVFPGLAPPLQPRAYGMALSIFSV